MNSIEAQKQHLFELVADFDVAVLVCLPVGRAPFGRPVRIVEISADGTTLLATTDAPELTAIDDGAQVLLVFQGSRRNRFAWMCGPAVVERRRGEIERHWDESWRDWFPTGAEDPALCLVRVAGAEGEYWDRRQPGGLSEVLARARALIAGGTVSDPSPPHAKVKLACKAPARRGRRRLRRAQSSTIPPSNESAIDNVQTEGEAEP